MRMRELVNLFTRMRSIAHLLLILWWEAEPVLRDVSGHGLHLDQHVGPLLTEAEHR